MRKGRFILIFNILNESVVVPRFDLTPYLVHNMLYTWIYH